MCKMIIFAGAIIFKKPPDIPKNFHFSTCFKTYYRAALVNYLGYLVLSLVELVIKSPKNF